MRNYYPSVRAGWPAAGVLPVGARAVSVVQAPLPVGLPGQWAPCRCAIVWPVTFSQRLRARLIGLVSMALLFSQIAVAAYACPAMVDRVNRDAADMMAMAGMPCAEMMAAGLPLDPEQPALCMQHCQFGTTTQVVDRVPPAFLPVTALPALFEVSLDQGLDTVLSAWAEDKRLRDRPPPLALSIAHCCFRI